MNEFKTSINDIDCIVTVTNYKKPFSSDEWQYETFDFEIADMQGNDLCEMLTDKIERELLDEYKAQVTL